MKKKVALIITAVILLIGVIVVLLVNVNKASADAVKFKEEYEALNGTIRQSDGATYSSIDVPNNNPIKYIDAKETLEILKKDEAIIYIGAAWCPWCRNVVNVLFDVAKVYKVKTIYYLTLDDEKDTYEVQDGKLVKTKEGSRHYYKLLEELDKYLEEYIIKDENGKSYDTGEKRIYMPYVLAIKNGKVISDKVGTVELNEGQTKYDLLTESQYEELYKIYEEMFKKVYGEK